MRKRSEVVGTYFSALNFFSEKLRLLICRVIGIVMKSFLIIKF